MKDIIVIVGPTGIGKTKLSIMLAKHYNAEIINGDSVAIYKKLDIGSAKPTEEERDGVPHHLIDIKDVEEDMSVFEYQQLAREKINDIVKRGKRVIIVGGTGLYIKSALYNYQFQNGTTNNSYEDLSNGEILNKIKELSTNVDIHVNNRKRLVRMLNKLENNEKITNGKDELLYPIKIIGLTVERDVLYSRIDKRFDIMIQEGLLDEINSLKPYYKSSRILNSAIGYKEFYDYLFDEKPLNIVLDEIKKDTRNYAKRQYTFFKHQMNVKWFSVNLENFSETYNNVLKFIEENK